MKMSLMGNRFTLCVVVSLSAFLISPFAYATLPDDFAGTYSGPITYTNTACTPSTDNETGTASVNLTITQDTTNVFAGDGPVTSADGEIDQLALDITGTSETTFNFSWDLTGVTEPFFASGSGGGTVTSNGIEISGTGIESGGSTCSISFNGALTKTTANVIDPEVTSGSTVTEALLFNTQVQGTISNVSSHISGALSGLRFSGGPRVSDNQFKLEGATGLNAGDGTAIPYGVWGSYSYTDYENDLSSTAFDGSNHGFLGGVDFGFWDNTVLGVAFGYDSGDIDTTFNQGQQDTDSYTIAPYFGALLTDTMSIDFTVGYSKVDFDQYRIAPGTTTRITSAPDADRVFSAINLNAITFYDKWILGARVGAMYASSTIDSYTESNGTVVADSRAKLGSLSIAGDVAYSYKNYEPFLNLAYHNDFQLEKLAVTTGRQPSNDSDDILMTTGVRYFNDNGVTGNLEYSKRFLRDDFDEDRFSITIRADF
jgi:Autotransporter beta-domain